MVQSQEQTAGLLKIGAVAQRAGVSIDTVRYYERRGLVAPARRLASGYRLYEPTAVERIALARRLQSLAMTLDEVADALTAHDSGTATCASQRWRLEAVLERTRARAAELAAVESSLHDVLRRCAEGRCELVVSGPRADSDRPHPR
jgi:DNA-binding transcriptional MerR regulator